MPSDTSTNGDTDARSADVGTRLGAIGVAVGITVGAIVVSVVGGVAFVIPIVLLEYDVESAPVFLALTVAGQIGFLVVAYWYARRRGLRIRISRPDAREIGYVIGGTVAALAVASALAYVLQSLDMVPESVIEDVTADNPNTLLGLAVLSVVVVAPIEEFLFRGVIQGRLREVFGPVGAVVGASLLFGSVHLANYSGSVGSVVAGALLIAGTGLVLGTAYERTGNLTVPVVAHALYNVVLLVGGYLAI